MSRDSTNIRLQNVETNLVNAINRNSNFLGKVVNSNDAIDDSLKNVSGRELNFNGYAQVLLSSAGGTVVKADTDLVVQDDPEHRVGWNLTNSVGGTKFNLYYFNGTQEIITLRQLQSVYFKGFINVNSETQSMPFIHVYTKPTGSGDAGPFYHSKIDYTYNSDNIIGIGEECVFYGEGEPLTKFTNRKIQLNTKTITGDGLPSEEILYLAVSSDSSASAGAVNCTLNNLGFDAIAGNVGDFSIYRNLVLVSESSLTGGATQAKQDDMITEIKDIDTTLQGTITVSETFLRANQNGDFTVSATSNNTSNGINMSPAGNPTYRQVVIFGDTDNITDTEIHLQVSNDNSNWFTAESILLIANPLNPLKKNFYKLVDSPPQWVRLLKINTTGSLETVSVKSSRIN